MCLLPRNIFSERLKEQNILRAFNVSRAKKFISNAKIIWYRYEELWHRRIQIVMNVRYVAHNS